MYLIAGLGNPGRKYEATRHNMGFDAVDELIDRHGIVKSGVKFDAMYGKGRIAMEPAVLLKPLLYMNLSGGPVRAMCDYYKADPEKDLIVIYDDISLSPGQIRIRKKGSAGGHNGMKDIIRHLGTQNFIRVRIGVGPKPEGWDLVNHVLGRFSGEERKIIDQAVERAANAVEVILKEGADAAMNQFNG